MADEKLRQLTINQSMTKPLLIMGCDRSLFATSAIMCGYVGFNLGFSRGNWGIMFLAAGAWFLISFGLRLMGKADPLMMDVFRRSSSYSDRPFINQFFYPAHSLIERGRSGMPPSVTKRWL
ncbi:MAG: VirB3 family type IV secretion system protein [Synergistaceae bacterium]|jgi:type IV secretory pathway TrbD component|nr:VirB3 family type IV secretion system protein [Synergistaceae bacterium]